MEWPVEYTDEFGDWWSTLSEAEQISVDAHVRKLEGRGPNLPFPYSSGVAGSRHPHMRELRVQSGGAPLRVFYAFDPRRSAILLIGGDKTGVGRFYERMIPLADDSTTNISRNWKRRKPVVGRRSFSELRAGMTAAARAEAEAEALRLDEAMDLSEVRRALKLSQDEIAQTLQVGQGSVAKIEKRTDMYVSTLRRFIEAMGGELEIVARFPDHSVRIKTFAELGRKEPA